MDWRRRLAVGLLTILTVALAVIAMGLITIHTRPLTPESIAAPQIQ
jgi:hypothetical protein